uniref:Retrotransposable element Tf2 n=1 Tax=Cajanus cajan TaxID=3821 RepID=A0A151RTY4_CAJCA|nr:Retrotransposable element Tf2 [Cajanus cajan]
MTPFQALYGIEPPLLIKARTIPSKVEAVNQLNEQRDQMLQELKQNLLKAQDQMHSYANKHRRLVEFEVGDWVYLKLQPYRLRSLAKRPNEKLASRFYGPFQIISKVGAAAYKLELPAHSKIHPVFHVSAKESTPTAATTSIIASYAK